MFASLSIIANYHLPLSGALCGIANMSLESYISESFKNGLRYNDAAQLCLRLFCSVDKIPTQYHAECNKDNLAVVFTNLSINGLIVEDNHIASKYRSNVYSINDNAHWLAVIASIFKVGNTVDSIIGDRLICHITSYSNGR
jgi:hypothetical protein